MAVALRGLLVLCQARRASVTAQLQVARSACRVAFCVSRPAGARCGFVGMRAHGPWHQRCVRLKSASLRFQGNLLQMAWAYKQMGACCALSSGSHVAMLLSPNVCTGIAQGPRGAEVQTARQTSAHPVPMAPRRRPPLTKRESSQCAALRSSACERALSDLIRTVRPCSSTPCCRLGGRIARPAQPADCLDAQGKAYMEGCRWVGLPTAAGA